MLSTTTLPITDPRSTETRADAAVLASLVAQRTAQDLEVDRAWLTAAVADVVRRASLGFEVDGSEPVVVLLRMLDRAVRTEAEGGRPTLSAHGRLPDQ